MTDAVFKWALTVYAIIDIAWHVLQSLVIQNHARTIWGILYHLGIVHDPKEGGNSGGRLLGS